MQFAVGMCAGPFSISPREFAFRYSCSSSAASDVSRFPPDRESVPGFSAVTRTTNLTSAWPSAAKRSSVRVAARTCAWTADAGDGWKVLQMQQRRRKRQIWNVAILGVLSLRPDEKVRSRVPRLCVGMSVGDDSDPDRSSREGRTDSGDKRVNDERINEWWSSLAVWNSHFFIFNLLIQLVHIHFSNILWWAGYTSQNRWADQTIAFCINRSVL